jgi:hypothetical protein
LNRRLLGLVLVVLAAASALLSYTFHWAKLTIGSASVSPVSSYVGYRRVGLIGGLVLVLCAVLIWRLKPREAKRWGGVAVVAGAFVGGFAIYDLTTEKSRSVARLAKSVAGILGMPVDQARSVLEAEVAKGLVKVTFTPGLWLALAAAALAVVGGIVTFSTSVEEPAPSAPERPDETSSEEESGEGGSEPGSS